MPRIRWESQYDEADYWWDGYLGKARVATINVYSTLYLTFMGCEIEYTKLSSAKRGAERMLQKFMDEAGLEVKDA